MTAIQRLMRYNDFEKDALENNDPCWAVMCRADLYESDARGSGGIDTKVADLQRMKSLNPMIQSGPTHDQQPVFKWTQLPNTSHVGLPVQYGFDWIDCPSVL